jgi:hypothetical protein
VVSGGIVRCYNGRVTPDELKRALATYRERLEGIGRHL